MRNKLQNRSCVDEIKKLNDWYKNERFTKQDEFFIITF